MKNIIYLFAVAALMSAGCSSGGGNDTPEPPKPQAVKVTGVGISSPSLNLGAAGSATLTANVAPDNADDKTVTWSSGDNSVAKVSQAGLVEAVGNGTTTIKVKTTDGGFEASCTVTVSIPAAAELAEEDAARFSEYIAELLAANPGRLIELDTGGLAVFIEDDATLADLSSLHVENPAARVRIVDADGAAADLDIEELYTLKWDLRPGGTARWIHASGVKTIMAWSYSRGQATPIEIIIPTGERNTLTITTPYGNRDIPMIEMSERIFPFGYVLMMEKSPYGDPRRPLFGDPSSSFSLDFIKFGLFVSDYYVKKSGMDTTQETFGGKTAMLLQYFRDNSIGGRSSEDRDYAINGHWDISDWYDRYGDTDIRNKHVVYYDAEMWQRDIVSKKRFEGKEIYTGADIWVNPDKRDPTAGPSAQ